MEGQKLESPATTPASAITTVPTRAAATAITTTSAIATTVATATTSTSATVATTAATTATAAASTTATSTFICRVNADGSAVQLSIIPSILCGLSITNILERDEAESSASSCLEVLDDLRFRHMSAL
mmetsp:Transcript_8744/g.14883  ORF Transcript_8744/g.14883 Transcript_8744/m.14883 type:complete len:127 (-) Transcript_8744:247-627(-)